MTDTRKKSRPKTAPLAPPLATPLANEDDGFGESHGYGPGHGGPSGPGVFAWGDESRGSGTHRLRTLRLSGAPVGLFFFQLGSCFHLKCYGASPYWSTLRFVSHSNLEVHLFFLIAQEIFSYSSYMG